MGQALRGQGGEVAEGPYVALRDVTKRFGAVVAVDGVSLDIRRGEIVCFLGPSGCGKSTLLRIMAGLEPQTSGAVIQDGVDVSRRPPAQRDFGIVFQSYALFPNLTAAQNVAYGLESRRRSASEVRARVAELLSLVGLVGLGHRYPAQLSGGQQQRVALARALALSPSLLLLDEPLSALDTRVRISLRSEILRLHRRLGITTVLVTHDREEALTMADRILVMDGGRMVQAGTPREIYTAPATPFVADFVGAVNFLAGVAHREPGRVRCGAFTFPVEVGGEAATEGDPVTLAIRPEEIRIHSRRPENGSLVAARLVNAEFVGPLYRLRLSAEAGELGGEDLPLVATVPAHEARGLPTLPDSRLWIELPHESLRAYPGPLTATALGPATG